MSVSIVFRRQAIVVAPFLLILVLHTYGLRSMLMYQRSLYNPQTKSRSLCKLCRWHLHSTILPEKFFRSGALGNDHVTGEYEFIDCGDFKRLELFSNISVLRSCPAARWPRALSSSQWQQSQEGNCFSYDGTSGKFGAWSKTETMKAPFKDIWTVQFDLSPEGDAKNRGPLQIAETGTQTEQLGRDRVLTPPTSTEKSIIKFSLLPSDMGQLGVFPEQYENWKWIRQRLIDHKDKRRRGPVAVSAAVAVADSGGSELKTASETNSLKMRKVLNGFAYTGGSTMAALSASDVSVIHLDAAKSFVQWAKRNAVMSDLATDVNSIPMTEDNDQSITRNVDNKGGKNGGREGTLPKEGGPTVIADRQSRWITDDCMTFLEREVRRGNKYEGLIFDPPAFGRGGSGKIWKLERDMSVLVEGLIPQLISDDPALVLLSCHDPDWPAERLAGVLHTAISSRFKSRAKSPTATAAAATTTSMVRDGVGKNRNRVAASTSSVKSNALELKLPPAPAFPASASKSYQDSIQSIQVAGGVLEYGPLGLQSSQRGRSLPLGVFARWSPV